MAVLPIIILTAKDGLFDHLRAKAIGANEFLSNPISDTEVMRVLRTYVDSE